MKTSTAGTVLVALAFASMIGGLSVGTALGDDNDRHQTQQNRREQDRREQERRAQERRAHDRREQELDRRAHGGWRDNRGVWHAYQPVYVPPPVVYTPSPSPGISIFFPFFR
jgi:hypothetical protein